MKADRIYLTLQHDLGHITSEQIVRFVRKYYPDELDKNFTVDRWKTKVRAEVVKNIQETSMGDNSGEQ